MMHTQAHKNTANPAGQVVNRPAVQTLADYVRAVNTAESATTPCPAVAPIVALADLMKAVEYYEKAGFNHQKCGNEASHAVLTRARLDLHHHMATARRTMAAATQK